MPMPVSVTAKAMTRVGLVERRRGEAGPLRRRADPQPHGALLRELHGVREQVAQDLLEPLLVGDERRRGVGVELDLEARGPSPPPGAGTSARRTSTTSSSPTAAGVHVHLPGLDLGEVEDVVDQVEQLVAGREDRPREVDLLVAEVAVAVVRQQPGQDEQRVERRPQLVGHVGQELGLVLRGERELLGLLLDRQAGHLDLAVLDLDALVLVGEQRHLLGELGVGALQLLLPALQLLGERLGLLQQLLRPHVGDDGVDHDADRLGELLQERAVHLARTARRTPARCTPSTWSSKSTGCTRMLLGAARPRPEPISDVVRRRRLDQDRRSGRGPPGPPGPRRGAARRTSSLRAGSRSWRRA